MTLSSFNKKRGRKVCCSLSVRISLCDVLLNSEKNKKEKEEKMKNLRIMIIVILLIAVYCLVYSDWNIHVTVTGCVYEPSPTATIFARFYPYFDPADNQYFHGNGQYLFLDVWHWLHCQYAESFIVDEDPIGSGIGPITQPTSYVHVYLPQAHPKPPPEPNKD